MYSIRQYIKPGFEDTSFPRGKLSPTGWDGFFDYQEVKMASDRKFIKVEGATLAEFN